MVDRLTSMTAFVRAAEAGSFARAAEDLGMSPQMVAKHVRLIEDRVGMRLINRTTRRQSLTEVGRSYYERCRTVLAAAAAADALMDEIRAEPRGRLRITAPVTFGSHGLVPLVTQFLRDHPAVQVDLTLTDRSVDLVEEGFEAAFRIGPPSVDDLEAQVLAPYRLMACAAPAYLDRHGTPLAPADLAGHECLGYAYWSRPPEGAWRFACDGLVHTVAVRSRLLMNDSRGLLTAALDGFGIVLCAEDVLRDHMDGGRLVRILPGYEAPMRAMRLLSVPDRHRTPKVRRFIEAATRRFAPP